MEKPELYAIVQLDYRAIVLSVEDAIAIAKIMTGSRISAQQYVGSKYSDIISATEVFTPPPIRLISEAQKLSMIAMGEEYEKEKNAN